MAAKKRITQDTFDAAVKDNQETFDMSPEEALEAAITEFKLQGVDLSSIIKRSSAEDQLSTDAKDALDTLAQQLDAGSLELDAITQLNGLLQQYSSRAPELLAVLGTKGAIALLQRAIEHTLTTACPDNATLTATLSTLRACLTTADNRKMFVRSAGVAMLLRAWEHKDAGSVWCGLCDVAAAAATACEPAKADVMDHGLAQLIVQWLGEVAAATKDGCMDVEAVCSASSVLVALTTPDDTTAPSSRAFPNARRLASWGAASHLTTILCTLSQQQQQQGGPPLRALLAVCTALKGLSANEEICREVAQEGGLTAAATLLQQGLDLEPTVACIALVRQLANSDTNKADILSAGGGDMLLCLLQAYSNPAGWDVTEQVLGTLCALTLRNPEASEALMELGVLDAVMEVLQEGYQQATAAGVGKKAKAQASSIIRQSCMTLRNATARSTAVRTALLQKGVEPVLRQVLGAGVLGVTTREAASACVRDLGLDNYQLEVAAEGSKEK